MSTRSIGVMLSGRNLGSALEWALARGFTAGVIHRPNLSRLGAPGNAGVPLHVARTVPLFGYSTVPLRGPRSCKIHQDALARCQAWGLSGYVVPARGTLEEDLGLTPTSSTPVLLMNRPTCTLTALADWCAPRLPGVGVAFDLATAWRAETREPWDRPLAFARWVEMVAASVQVLILRNVGRWRIEPVTILTGEIPPSIYVRLLQAFPGVPVLLMGLTPVQAEMEQLVIRHMERVPELYMDLPAGCGLHAGGLGVL